MRNFFIFFSIAIQWYLIKCDNSDPYKLYKLGEE